MAAEPPHPHSEPHSEPARHHRQPPAAREAAVSVYGAVDTPPAVERVSNADLEELIEALTERTWRLASEQGGAIPREAVHAVVENLVHADFNDVVVSILDGGNTVRVADRGPGIADKQNALLPGFTTATGKARRLLKGVGSGLAVAHAALKHRGGGLELDDNLDGGTVVTLWLPAESLEAEGRAPGPPAAPVSTTERQLKVLLLLLELGPTGPTRLGEELGVSSSTAYREMVRLEEVGLVEADEEGHRTVTADGLRHVEAVL